MHPATKQRTTHFVDRSVQGALARRVLVHWVLFLFTSIVAVTLMQILLGDPNRSIFDHAAAAASRYALFLIVLLSLLPAFVLDTVRLSNRFAGPVCRLRSEFRQVASGAPYEPLKFRGRDFWQGLATDYNAMMERVIRDTHPQVAESSTEPAAVQRETASESHEAECTCEQCEKVAC